VAVPETGADAAPAVASDTSSVPDYMVNGNLLEPLPPPLLGSDYADSSDED
jgi:hypothetical protein